MVLSVRSNIAALATTHNVARTADSMDTSLKRLSSGYRVAGASDNAAGLEISEGLRAQISGMTQAVRNAQDGISVAQIADGTLGQSTALLQRMRDLAVRGANRGVLDATAQRDVQKEMAQLKNELNHIADTTTFNGRKLLDGSYTGTFQVGANTGETLSLVIGQGRPGMGATGLGVSSVDVTGSVTVPSTATPAVSDDAGTPTAGTLVLAGDYTTTGTYASTFQALAGTITYNGKMFDLGSVDYSGAVTASDYLGALSNAAATALGTSTSAFTVSGAGLTFTGATPATGSTDADAQALSPEYTGGSGASAAIPLIDKAIDRISKTRADLGAFQQRLQHTISRLGVAITNTTTSDSRIRDTDMAGEMANYSRQQVLTQSGTAMLAQANNSSQSILKLLGA
jgi:flagellin